MKLPVDEFGRIDSSKLTIEQNHARLNPLLKALTASLKAGLNEPAKDTANEIERTCRAIWWGLQNQTEAARSKRAALTLARKDPS